MNTTHTNKIIIKNPHFTVMQTKSAMILIASDLTYFCSGLNDAVKCKSVSTNALHMCLTVFSCLRDAVEYDVFPIEVEYERGYDGETIKHFRFTLPALAEQDEFKIDEYTCEGCLYNDRSGYMDINFAGNTIYTIEEDVDTELCGDLVICIDNLKRKQDDKK